MWRSKIQFFWLFPVFKYVRENICELGVTAGAVSFPTTENVLLRLSFKGQFGHCRPPFLGGFSRLFLHFGSGYEVNHGVLNIGPILVEQRDRMNQVPLSKEEPSGFLVVKISAIARHAFFWVWGGFRKKEVGLFEWGYGERKGRDGNCIN